MLGLRKKRFCATETLPSAGAPKLKNRLARLRDKRLHDLVDGLVAGGCLRVPEVLRGGVAVFMRGQIGVHAFAEGFLAEIVLHHQQHVAGLAVGDAVEHLVDLVGRVGLGADGARGGLRIDVERALFVAGHNLRNVPLGMHRGHGLFSIHVAKPSLSQMLSHHCMVTRSPNHWCAISCVMSSAASVWASM